GRSNLRDSGFTLVELLVVLALVGLMFGLSVTQFGRLFHRDLKQSANHLASTIRYLYNKAQTEGVTLRLVFDFEQNSYFVESTSQQITLSKEEEETKEEKSVFSPQESYLLKPVKLKKGTFLRDVYAEHQLDFINAGRAYIHFFPRGYVEKSIIRLRDKNDETSFSLEVNPVTGSVKISKGLKELDR
ncbi:MAG: prepilin-type N-terminal cleavage/methylation domain-containing protein, partial [Deltaproteobacteria bacterium]|nr:prepilin-type N-terminal cleavage/methylation domain-containing protein [Deltaproteobacteria bacterium]